VLVVVVEKSDEEAPGLSMRADDPVLDGSSQIVNRRNLGRGSKPLSDIRQAKEQRKVKRCIDSDQIFLVGRASADKARDLELVVIYLSESKKVLLAGFKRIFANRIAKKQREIRLDILQRVDAEPVDIPFRDGVLIA